MSPVLLIVSLDSESLPFLEQQISLGNLPNLAAILNTGKRVPLSAAKLPGSAYPVLYTGRHTTDLGHYFPIQWSSIEQRVMPWMHGPQPTLLERIDAAGARVVLLDPPEGVPMKLRNGFAISGLQCRVRVLLHPWSSDDEEKARLLNKIGPAARADEVFGKPDTGSLRKLSQTLLKAPERLTAAALHYLKDATPDCLWINCCALHIGAHQFFNLNLLDDPAARHELVGTRLKIAQGYDRMLGEVMSHLPSGAGTLVFYPKGMVPAHGWIDLLPEMLRRVLGERSHQSSEFISKVRSLMPQALRRFVADRMPESLAIDTMAKLSTPHVDWNSTRAFCMPSDCPGFIRLNLQGREKEGAVNPAHQQELLDEIQAGLRSFTDLDGEPAIESILTPAALFGHHGESIDTFPDLIVNWNPKPNLLGGGVTSPRFGQLLRTSITNGRSGYHGPGALAAFVPGNHAWLPQRVEMRIEDIPATMLECLGLPHNDLPGRAWMSGTPQ
jgi:hypothetical protein